MELLNTLQPERVFYYFQEISRIPRGSGHTQKISAYLMEFARNHGLEAAQDSAGNVVILKEGTEGYEHSPVVILQGHSDMVCEKKPGSSHDFQTEGLDLILEGDFLSARDTTLGGDDGIAVAYMLAILESRDIPHPPLEAVITADEEIGLLGAGALDLSALKGRRLINLDSEEEGHLLCGCAGGMTARCGIPVRFGAVSGCWYEITISGLQGGHSGSEIHKNRANSNLLAGRLLYRLGQRVEYVLSELSGGTKDNAIPRETRMLVGIDSDEKELLKETLRELQEELRGEYRGTEEGLILTAEEKGAGTEPAPSPHQPAESYLFPDECAQRCGENERGHSRAGGDLQQSGHSLPESGGALRRGQRQKLGGQRESGSWGQNLLSHGISGRRISYGRGVSGLGVSGAVAPER